jgi:RNA 3'-terminal phosphate cyclase (GTP)
LILGTLSLKNYIKSPFFLFPMINIDGSYLEGGGQIVRTALALSVLTQKPFTVNNIRLNRSDPGLKNQHLHGIRALRELCNGVVEGAQLGSSQITFYPRKITKGQDVVIDIGTAGSITLILQSLLLPCIFSGKKIHLHIKGGTDVAWSPSGDYFSQVIFPQFLRYGKVTFSLKKRGYYPKGQGEVEVVFQKRYLFDEIVAGKVSVKLLSLLEQGKLIKISGVSHASDDLAAGRVAERQAEAARTCVLPWKVPVDIISTYNKTASTGSGIVLWAVFSREGSDVDTIDPIRVGADVLGEKGKRVELVGEECAVQLNNAIASGAPVDRHLADQLIPLLGIVCGEIAVQEITKHTLTNIYVTELFLDVKFEIDEKLKIIKVVKK